MLGALAHRQSGEWAARLRTAFVRLYRRSALGRKVSPAEADRGALSGTIARGGCPESARKSHPAQPYGPTLATADVYYLKPSPTQGNPLIGAVPDTVSVYKTCLRADPTPYTI